MSNEEKKEESKMRQIIIETDGNSIKLTKVEVAGEIELLGILEGIIKTIYDKRK